MWRSRKWVAMSSKVIYLMISLNHSQKPCDLPMNFSVNLGKTEFSCCPDAENSCYTLLKNLVGNVRMLILLFSVKISIYSIDAFCRVKIINMFKICHVFRVIELEPFHFIISNNSLSLLLLRSYRRSNFFAVVCIHMTLTYFGKQIV